MKKLLILIILLVIPIGLIYKLIPVSLDHLFSYSYCDQPIHYRIDTVDPKFNLSREAFISDINQAAQIWNHSKGKNLFVYDPKGDLSINLIFDERQSLTNQINQLENQVQSEKQSLNPKINEYKSLSQDFKQKIASLNKEIGYWNNQGGAPPDEYNKIISQQKDLQAEANQLNAMADSLNISTDQYNSQVGELNQTIGSFNNTLEERPEEGIFKGPEDRIEIYFNISKPELIHTLAHELGHVLRLPHNNNPRAIMYYKTSQSMVVSTEDMAAITEACKQHSILELAQNYLAQILIRFGIDR